MKRVLALLYVVFCSYTIDPSRPTATIEYRGFVCTFQIHEDATTGYAISINLPTPKTFDVRTFAGVKSAFETAVDNYLSGN